MDPVSLGVAAAALLASKFGEGFAKDAGASTWNAVKRLRDVVATKFHRHPESATTATALVAPRSVEDTSATAAWITAAAVADPRFGAEVGQLVTAACQEQRVERFVAQAFDNAKQVNIHGDNVGTINLG